MNYRSSGDDAVLSRSDNLASDSSGATKYAQYVWDARYIDAPVVRFHDSNTDGTLDDTLYYATDANMNVTARVALTHSECRAATVGGQSGCEAGFNRSLTVAAPIAAPPATWAMRLACASVQWACPAGALPRRAWHPRLVGRGWACHPAWGSGRDCHHWDRGGCHHRRSLTLCIAGAACLRGTTLPYITAQPSERRVAGGRRCG